MRGWPQSPIPIDVSHDAATSSFTFGITAAVPDNPPMAPGAKELHLIGLGFQNPAAGKYPVEVTITRSGNAETDTGVLKIKSRSAAVVQVRTGGAQPGVSARLIGKLAGSTYLKLAGNVSVI